MAQSAITSAFENYKAMEAAGGRKVVIDSYVLAFIPDLDMDKGPQPDEVMPDASQIVHRQGVTRMAMINADTVGYTITLDESVGDFIFNWLALTFGDDDQPAVIVYLDPQKKNGTINGKQGNVLTYSVLMEYAGAQAQTGITTPASTWQIDFSRRLSGMDDLTRLNAMEIYGDALFFSDAFKLSPGSTPDTLTMQTGTAYVRGVRVSADRPADVTLPAGRTEDLTISLDVAFQGSVTSEHKATYTLTGGHPADYTDTLDLPHFVQPLARIATDGAVTDLRRVGKAASDQLQGDFLEVSQNLNDVPDKAKARDALQLGDSATKNTGTTEGTVAAGDDSRITGAMQKDQNGADIPDKPLFVQTIGLKDTVDRASHIAGNGDITGDVWGGWISAWLNTQFSARDNNINTRGTVNWINQQLAVRDNNINARATIDWVNQNFANKSTASLATNGWFRDASTGWIIQWGTYPGGTGTYTVNLPQPFPHAGLWAMGWVAGALSYGDDDWSNSAGLLNNNQIKVTVDHGWSTAWIAIGY
ncbi:phage tail protein [Salmonella enterica]